MPFGLAEHFDQAWAIDFEFFQPDGETPLPVAMVAKEIGTGRVVEFFHGEFPEQCPFDTGPRTLFVAYFASAEISCFLALGWPVPERVLDLFTEFRRITNNGVKKDRGFNSLLNALSFFGITSITSEVKEHWRKVVMAGPPYSDADRRGILDYCGTDVFVLPALIERMLPHIDSTEVGLGQALLRGRYMCAVARMERTGVPIDTDRLNVLLADWESIKVRLIEEVDKDYGVYSGTTFRSSLFQKYLDREGIAWPRAFKTDALLLDEDTFRDMSKLYPQIIPLKELRHAMGELRLNSLKVGSDGRNRTMLSPFRAVTGRNQPSNSEFVFGPSTWVRSLVKPKPGRALAYLDWSSQEVWIAAVLSGDKQMLADLESGDPYLAFAKRAGLVPEDATKKSHARERDGIAKPAVLGSNYGQQAASLSYQCGLTGIQAADVLDQLRRGWPTYFHWSEQNIHRAILTGGMSTVFGWTRLVAADTKPNSLRNYPMQANGAEMLRLACCLLTEAGIDVCAPVHDAVLIEADVDEIVEVAAKAQELMSQAAAAVLNGQVVKIGEPEYVKPDDRYRDKRGVVMWAKVMGLLGIDPLT